MKYVDALTWLYRRQNLGVKLGLHNIEALLERLDRPQDAFTALHVTGTSGKGSTATFLDAMLRAGGHRVGLYTSPHLVTFRERIQVDGAMIAEQDVVRGVQRIRPHVEALEAEGTTCTYFECVTALAFDHYRAQNVAHAVVEVGLGGRLDATQPCHPLVSVITNVGLDHTHVLGTGVPAIAREKAGILRPKVPAITGARREALDVIAREATRLQAPLRVVRAPDPTRSDLDGNAFTTTFGGATREFRTRALGAHQVQNACVALAALDAVRGALPVDANAAARALAETILPGRLELARRDPVQLLDGAHNAESMEALAAFLGDALPGRRVAACVGILRDKPAQAMLNALAERVHRLVLTQVPSPRTLEVHEIERLVPRTVNAYETHRDPEDALRSLYAGDEDVTLVTGSLYLVGDARARLMRLERDPPVPLPRLQ